MRKPESPPKVLALSKIKILPEDFQNIPFSKHLHWDQVKNRLVRKEQGPHVWSLIKHMREGAGYLKLKFGNHHIKWINLPATQETLYNFDRDYGAFNNQSDESGKLFLQSESVKEEAVSSSILEGAVTTRKVALEMMEHNRKPKTHGEKMVLNNFISMNFIKEVTDQEMTESLLLQIHELMTRGTLDNPDDEGSFRSNDDVSVVDGITGEIFWIPPGHVEAVKMIKELIHFINADRPFIHPIIKASIIHFMIGYIHPFVDGNGRTARALFYWYLLKKNYRLMEYLSISNIILNSKTQYYKAYLYAESDENDVTYFILYQIKVLDKAFKALVDNISRIERISEGLYQSRIGHEDLNERQKLILASFEDNPRAIWTVRQAMNLFKVVQETARKDFLELESKKLLRSSKEGKRKIYFKA